MIFGVVALSDLYRKMATSHYQISLIPDVYKVSRPVAEFVGWPYHMRWDATQDVWQRIGMAGVVFTADSKVGPVLVTC